MQEEAELTVEDLEAGLLLESCEEILRFGDKVSGAFPELALLADKWAEAEKKADESFMRTSLAAEMGCAKLVADQSKYDVADAAFADDERAADKAWNGCRKWIDELKKGQEP